MIKNVENQSQLLTKWSLKKKTTKKIGTFVKIQTKKPFFLLSCFDSFQMMRSMMPGFLSAVASRNIHGRKGPFF